jgi:hypothetical protein
MIASEIERGGGSVRFLGVLNLRTKDNSFPTRAA